MANEIVPLTPPTASPQTAQQHTRTRPASEAPELRRLHAHTQGNGQHETHQRELQATSTVDDWPETDSDPVAAGGEWWAVPQRSWRRRRLTSLVLAWWWTMIVGPLFAVLAMAGFLHPPGAFIVVTGALLVGFGASAIALALLEQTLEAPNQ